jgi:D-alanyl-D-alanine carboxypeptidase
VDTPCGTIWGHTGGALGHSSLMFASQNGHRTLITDSTTVFDDEEEPSETSQAVSAAEETLLVTAVCRLYGKNVPQDATTSGP